MALLQRKSWTANQRRWHHFVWTFSSYSMLTVSRPNIITKESNSTNIKRRTPETTQRSLRVMSTKSLIFRHQSLNTKTQPHWWNLKVSSINNSICHTIRIRVVKGHSSQDGHKITMDNINLLHLVIRIPLLAASLSSQFIHQALNAALTHNRIPNSILVIWTFSSRRYQIKVSIFLLSNTLWVLVQ